LSNRGRARGAHHGHGFQAVSELGATVAADPVRAIAKRKDAAQVQVMAPARNAQQFEQ
jgi:hypothetical protein